MGKTGGQENTYELDPGNGLDDLKNSADHVEAVNITRLTEDDVVKVASEAMTMWSATGWRIVCIMFVQGCNQAGYGIDWGVIGGINSIKSWHDYFHFENSGSTYGLLNALMNIGQIVGAIFLGIADIPWIGRRGLNFFGNAFVIFACVFCAFSVNIRMVRTLRRFEILQ